MYVYHIYSLHYGIFCRLLIRFANEMLDTLIVFLEELFENIGFEKTKQISK